MPDAAGRVTLSGTTLEPVTKHAVAVNASNAVAVRRRVLIVSPHFPPVDAPDMQRVRVSLAYFREFGWDPYVLAVAPDAGDTLEPLFAETIDASVPVERVRAASSSLTRVLGIGNVAIRALPFLYTAGARLIERHHIDLVYCSTTMFLSMPLARVWKARFGTPYVLDFQDPWVTDYYDTHPESSPPPKYGLARRVHALMEPWTLARVDGLVAVSDAYIKTLRARYPSIDAGTCATIPFAASRMDFELLAAKPQPNVVFGPDRAKTVGVYVGRGGDDMRAAARILFAGLNRGLTTAPQLFERVNLHFVGTDYASDDRARKTIEPVARELAVDMRVHERTARVPYFQALQLLHDADFLVLLGSDDEAYTASKVYPYLLAGKPIIAVVHERSGLVPLLRKVPSAVLVTFSSSGEATAVEAIAAGWQRILETGCRALPLDPDVERSCSAREMTRRQCGLFDAVLARGAR